MCTHWRSVFLGLATCDAFWIGNTRSLRPSTQLSLAPVELRLRTKPQPSMLAGVKSQADSVPLPLARGLAQALGDLIGQIYSLLKAQEKITGNKFAPIERRFVDLLRKYDADKSGALQLDEFCNLVSELRDEEPEGCSADLEQLFCKYDADLSGSLDTRELTKALVELGVKLKQDGPAADGIPTLKGTDRANWTPTPGAVSQVSLKPWGAPLEALFQDDFGAVKTMALFSAIKLADGAYGQFEAIVAGTWEGMPPNIKGFIPRLLKIAAALRLLEQHYATLADWEEDGDSRDGSSALREAYADARQQVGVLKLRLAGLMFLLVRREGGVPIRGPEKACLEGVLPPLGVEVTDGMTYADLANALDQSGRAADGAFRQDYIADELEAGAKDFAAYFRLRSTSKRDLTAFEQSCYGQAVEKQMSAVLKNGGKKGKEDLVLAELQALQALPF